VARAELEHLYAILSESCHWRLAEHVPVIVPSVHGVHCSAFDRWRSALRKCIKLANSYYIRVDPVKWTEFESDRVFIVRNLDLRVC